ncbi:MAG: MDR family MFS transporter [Acidimicrobiales bacterium]
MRPVRPHPRHLTGGGEAAGGTARTKVFVALILTLALSAMDSTIVATAIPSIVHDLGGFSLFAWVFSVYLLAQAVTIPVYGKLADLYGRKPVLVVGTLVFLAGSILSGLSWSMVALIAFRGLQGVGAGSIQPIANTIVGDLYTVEERAHIQGYLSGVWGVAAVVGPAIGGFFAQYLTWRAIFYINVPIGAVALYMISRHLHEQVARRRHRIDVAGSGLLAAGVGLLILGLLEGGVQWPWVSAPSLGVFGVAAAALGAFVGQERRAAEPMIPPWAFGRRLLAGANLGAGVIGLLTIGLTTFLPTFDQGVLGASAVVAGFALAAMSLGWPVMSGLSGRLYLRIGFRDTALIGSVVTVAAAVLFVSLPAGAPVWETAAASFLLGVGLGLMSTPLIVGVQSVVGWERRGVVTGANLFTRMLGSAVGAAVFGAIANGTLARWFRHAPAALAGQLPRSVDAASTVLGGGGSHLSGPAAAYVRQGLYLGLHRVFLALAAAAAVGVVVLVWTPRQFRALTFAPAAGGTGEAAGGTAGGGVGAPPSGGARGCPGRGGAAASSRACRGRGRGRPGEEPR